MDRPQIGGNPRPRAADVRTTIVAPRGSVPPPPRPRVGLIILIIFLIIVIIVLLVLVIIFALRRRNNITNVVKCSTDSQCSDGKKCFGGSCVECSSNSDCRDGKFCLNTVCLECSTPPRIPENVSVIYNSSTGTATVSWNSSPNAVTYNVYRKQNDPSVGVNNYDERRNTTGTSMNFTGLATDSTNYFAVTSVNTCGESPTSSPVFAPTCSSSPAQPVAPTIIPTANNCDSIQNSHLITASFPDQSLPNGAYVLRGNNQYGAVDDYHYIVMQSTFGPATGITQECNGQTSNHTLTHIKDTQPATITTGPSPPSPATTKTLSWSPVTGAEAYTYWVVGQELVTNNLRFYGGYVNGSTTSVTFPVNPNDTFVYSLVLGYKLCDISPPSPPTQYTSPT